MSPTEAAAQQSVEPGEGAVAELEAKISRTHGGVAEQPALSLPAAAIPTGVPTSIYDEVDPALYLGLRGVRRELRNKDGLRLQAYFWPADDPKAVVQFVHGHGAHLLFEVLKYDTQKPGSCGSYEGSWAQAWNARGISLCGIDLVGCGRSEGKRGGLRWYVDSFDDYVQDVLLLAREVQSGTLDVPGFSGGLPIFPCGISLGGCIAFNAALDCKEPHLFAGMALMAPMLSLEKVARKGLNPYIRPIASLLSLLVPTVALVATERNTLYPEIQALWDADPLCCHTQTRVRNASEYLRITERSMQRLEDVALPFCVFHSENDTMVDVDGSKALYTRAKSADKTLRLVNSMWHILVKEQGNEKVCSEIADWIEARVVVP